MRLTIIVRSLLVLLINMITVTAAYPQVTKIMGTVRNVQTGEPIPFVNVFFEGTGIGATSDFDGHYSIETFSPGDTLSASYIGYISQAQKVTPRIFQKIDFNLEPDEVMLDEVVILP